MALDGEDDEYDEAHNNTLNAYEDGGDDGEGYYFDDVPDSPPPARRDPIAAEAAAQLHGQHISAGGVLSTYHDKPARDASVHLSRVTSSVKALKKAASDAEEAAEKACRQERTELERLQHLRAVAAAREAELMELRAVAESKPNQAEVKTAFGKFREAQATEQEQALVADACFDAARARESERDALLLELTHERHKLEALADSEEVTAQVHRMAAPRRAQREARAAERIVDESLHAEERARQEEAVRMQIAEEQLAAARKGHKRAVSTLRDRVAKEREAEGKVDEGRMARLSQRADAVIALKESTETAAAEMRSANARRAEMQAEIDKQREVRLRSSSSRSRYALTTALPSSRTCFGPPLAAPSFRPPPSAPLLLSSSSYPPPPLLNTLRHLASSSLPLSSSHLLSSSPPLPPLNHRTRSTLSSQRAAIRTRSSGNATRMRGWRASVRRSPRSSRTT